MEPTKPGWKTTEFWLSLAAKVLGGLFAAGYLGDGTPAMRIAGIAAVVLTALGYTVSRAMVKAAGILLLIGLASTTQLGCDTLKEVPGAAGAAIIDCAKQDSAKLLSLSLDFANKLVTGTGDWAALESQAEAEGSALGECAFVEVWTKLHTPTPAGVAARTSPDPMARMLAHVGGAKFRLSDGSLVQ